MKVQPLNQTALQVSWSQPETIYHPPIMNYVISYSWTKNEDEKEKTFTKDSDKDLVNVGAPLQLGGGPATSLCQALQWALCVPPASCCRGSATVQWPPMWTVAEPAWVPPTLTLSTQCHPKS